MLEANAAQEAGVGVHTKGPNTRERILAAAGEVFAERGLKAATVRGIAARAGANVAALHYYFRDKEGLYQAVLDDLLATGFAKYPPDMGISPGATPEERLAAFVRAFLLRFLGEDCWGGYEGKGRLLAKEIADPSPALNGLVERHLAPHKEALFAIVRDLLGPGADPEAALLCALSVIGQCLHYVYARPIFERLKLPLGSGRQWIERLASHVAEFSLAGIRAAAGSSRQRRGKP